MDFKIEKYGLALRYVNQNDADFILKLRTEKNNSRFISTTINDIQAQERWIRKYKEREKAGLEYYFIVYDENKEAFATYRIYNKSNEMIEIGSFITKKNYKNPLSAIKLDILMKEFVFETLNYKCLNFEVRKLNFSVVRYHKEYKPMLIKEDKLNYFFIQTKKKFNVNKKKFKKLFKN